MFDIVVLEKLQQTLKEIYPEKYFDFVLMQFSALENNECCINPDFLVKKYERGFNLYDFTKTNFEWAFLDNIALKKLKEKKKVVQVTLKKGITFHILPFMRALLRLRVELFGRRVDICLGKMKE
jgi:hypothetical protein